jgi:hypothetical protein
MGSAYILKSDGTKIPLDHRPTLKEAQKIVGGYIEFAHCHNKYTLVVDEEGLLKGYPLNKEATSMYGCSPIVGDVIVLEGWKTVGG